MTDGTQGQRPLILVTRPAEDSRALVAALAALDCDSLVEPMLRIEPLADATVDLDGCDAVLFTSANGVRSLAALTDRRDLPVLTVGDASAAAAREARFGTVAAAGGDVTALAALVRETYPNPGAVFFHAAGSQVAGDLKGDLEALGHTVRRVPLYQAVPSVTLSDACREALEQGRIVAATFFSPRTAQAFVSLLEEQGYASRARTVRAVCLSPAVARKATQIEWAEISTAETPDMPALLERIQELIAMADDKKEPETEEVATEQTDGQTDDASDAGTGEEAITISADAVIEAFGGIRPMAAKLDVAVSTVQGWKTRDHIPDNRWRDVITAADAHGVDLSGALTRGSQAEGGTAKDAHKIDLHDVDTGVYDGPIDYEPKPNGDEADGAEEEKTADSVETDEATSAKSQKPSSAASKADAVPAKSGGGGLALAIGIVALAAAVTRPAWAPYTDPHLARYFPAMQQQAVTAAGTLPGADGSEAPTVDVAALNRLGEEVGALSDALALVKAEVGALSDRLDGMGATEDATPSATVAELPEALSGRLDDLAASVERDSETRQRVLDRLGVIENLLDQVSTEAEKATTAVAGMESAQADQRAELERLAARPAVEGATQAGLALGVGSVETALVAGRPFAQGLARIDTLAPETGPIRDAVERLKPFAANGVKSRAALVTAFQAAIPAMQGEIKAQETGDVVQDVLNGLQSLVSVRRKGDDPDAPPVSRAEAALARGDLVAAVAVLTPLREGSPTVAGWLDDAEARLAAEAGLAALQDGVAAGLTGLTTGQGDEGDGA